MKEFEGVFCKNTELQGFSEFTELISKENIV
jgi:hypothetical protein